MTDQPSSQSQPSMEDILASIRRIIDDEDVKTPAPVSADTPAPQPAETKVSFAVDDDAAALALAEYDAAMATDKAVETMPDPASESIFPQRGGALWRRVAGHPLSDGETDPLPADDTLELTETVDDELELSELLDSASEKRELDDSRILDDVVASDPVESGGSPIGVGAMTAAGIGAAAAASGGMMDRVTDKISEATEDDDVLDLTRKVDSDDAISGLASAMDGNSRFEGADDVPPPVFERVDVSTSYAPHSSGDEVRMDQTFETAEVSDLGGDYSSALSGKDDENDARERALDERFYKADQMDDMPPEIDSDYSASLGGVAKRPRNEGAPTEDEMETVGGLVRDALRGRLPVAQPSGPDNTPLVTGGAEESAARSLATLARYDAQAPRRIYGGIKITDDDDSPTIEGMVQDTLRPMLRDWLSDNLPTLVENMVKQEVDRISARSRRFVRDED